MKDQERRLSELEDPMGSLRAEARKQAEDEFKEIERRELLNRFLEEERAKLRPPPPEDSKEELVLVLIDVAPAMRINQANETGVSINGKEYIHGKTYEVSRALAADLLHVMAQGWKNERAMGHPNRDDNRRKIIDARVGQVMLA